MFTMRLLQKCLAPFKRYIISSQPSNALYKLERSVTGLDIDPIEYKKKQKEYLNKNIQPAQQFQRWELTPSARNDFLGSVQEKQEYIQEDRRIKKEVKKKSYI